MNNHSRRLAANRGDGRSGPSTRTPHAVIFDLGEVLASPTDLYASLAAPLERHPEAVGAAYWTYRDAYDRGGTAQAFWSSVLADLDVHAAQSVVAELTRIDTEAWTTIRPDAMSLLGSLANKGVRVGILSNATHEMAQAARRTSWAHCIADWFFSSELHLAKPDRAIYHHVANALELPPEDIHFIDDRPVNVEAALSAGWNAHIWISDASTRTLMSALEIPPEE